ncbi:MAG: UDP-N-acetylglucosamine 1-carboxyvinyltransferase [Chloroflexota bacterium]|nr:UDP-N-acetylglucosamine 1-carboxyvinyltransferase [Chloroflexota bacterium]MDQ5864681.1 UDP-N-acetylglucosamine 1-carboxyvinyltransferase [Chloroflexota bacterium]
MDKLIVEGGHVLNGEIVPAGNKNSAQPMLAACLLTDEPVTLHNVPDIADVRTLLNMLRDMGVEVEASDLSTRHSITLQARKVERQPDKFLGAKVRGSILMAGPLLTRTGYAVVGQPGGDAIGRRRVDTHLIALKALGAKVEVDNDQYFMEAPARLKGTDIFLDEASVTGTEQAILASVLAEGVTTICNAAAEPHVQDLCHMLNKLGAKISGIGTNTLSIAGVTRLHGGEHTIISDHIEIGSFIGLAAVTGGHLRIKKAVPEHLRMTKLVFSRLGVQVDVDGEDIVVPGGQDLRVIYDVHEAVPKIDDGIWPAFPSDLMSIALVTATQSEGTVLIFEKMFESRLFFVDRLISMGARIVLCDPHRCVVVGKSPLRGDEITSPDIRAGMALLLAALCADGNSTIYNVGQIDRGYEAIETRLEALGARIKRVRD